MPGRGWDIVSPDPDAIPAPLCDGAMPGRQAEKMNMNQNQSQVRSRDAQPAAADKRLVESRAGEGGAVR